MIFNSYTKMGLGQSATENAVHKVEYLEDKIKRLEEALTQAHGDIIRLCNVWVNHHGVVKRDYDERIKERLKKVKGGK